VLQRQENLSNTFCPFLLVGKTMIFMGDALTSAFLMDGRHINNVEYYSYFDTIVNQYLIKSGGLDIANGTTVGVVVETSCQFHSSIKFPQVIEAALRVTKIGKSR
jgi:hypothetical protein